LQPAVATVLAVRAGLKDAREGAPPFLWGVLSEPSHRLRLLTHGWTHVRNLLIVATTLDVIYQIVVHRWIYILELLITVTALAIVPYVLVRGPVNRFARMARHQPPSKLVKETDIKTIDEAETGGHDPAEPYG
jgi:hypothetical protein